MVKNFKRLKRFEDEQLRKNRILSISERFRIFNEMWKEAKKLGFHRHNNILEGLEADIRIAQVLNSCLKKH